MRVNQSSRYTDILLAFAEDTIKDEISRLLRSRSATIAPTSMSFKGVNQRVSMDTLE
jgi:hypothetical protein